ncbi:uncharacterized protein LOC129888389 [Solanum dulcamara]|uniref:uncharacterized protein LOC129888389 n=1 Tax=Solanum dulcamara TaxID=45834 RepID=UPI0024855A29|nr:uncharacterized protein LOC129888389 [Solanum dulcamara]
MAIDMISEAPSLVTSPRISFSSDDVCSKQVLDLHHQSDSNSDFDFCISNSANTETCSADELFLDGLIRPLQLQEKFVTLSKTLASPSTPNQNAISKQDVTITTTISVGVQKDQNKSFWRIGRSTSLHGNKKSSFWSLPRSNSTGSKSCSIKESHKQNAQFKQMKYMTNSSAASFYTSQKPPLRKNYNNGVHINPILNVPPTFIPKATANLLGFGSFFSNGKQNKSKK